MDEAFKQTLFGRVEREVMAEIGLSGAGSGGNGSGEKG
jgi:hypothetical protein